MTHHLSEEQICRAIAGQSTLDEQRHVVACAECLDAVERSMHALSAFRAAVHSRAEQRPAPELPPFATRTHAVPRRGWLVAAAAAIGVLAAVVGRLPQRTGVEKVDGIETGARSEAVSEFLPLPYSTVPMTESHLVRLEVSNDALAAFGLETPGQGGNDALLADVVVGNDGLARAVRFVRVINDSSKEKLP
jgi:hypothetical protein